VVDLADVAAAQAGVFSRLQARQAGWSAWRIRRKVETGEWCELYGGRALVASTASVTLRGWDHAALLACGDGSVLAGPSAGRWFGMGTTWPQPTVLVDPTTRRLPGGITLIRDRLDTADLVFVDDTAVTSRARTVIDCLRLLPEPNGRTLLDRALQQGWVTFEQLVERTHRLTGRRGTPRLVRHVRTASLAVRSEAERVLRRLLLRAGIGGWVSDFRVAGVGVVDFAFPDLRLALEVDGRAWHSAAERFQSDRTRQNALVAAGWTVLRFTWEDLTTRPGYVVATIRATHERLASAA
jgi:very-short-patch-repair endonuclease